MLERSVSPSQGGVDIDGNAPREPEDPLEHSHTENGLDDGRACLLRAPSSVICWSTRLAEALDGVE